MVHIYLIVFSCYVSYTSKAVDVGVRLTCHEHRITRYYLFQLTELVVTSKFLNSNLNTMLCKKYHMGKKE